MLIRDGINHSNWRPHETDQSVVYTAVRARACVYVLVTSLISVAKDRSRRRRGLGRVTIRSVIRTRTPSPDALLPPPSGIRPNVRSVALPTPTLQHAGSNSGVSFDAYETNY